MSPEPSSQKNEKAPNFLSKRIGIVGAGSMGSMMALGLSEIGVDISIWDISSDNVKQALSRNPKEGEGNGKISGFIDISDFANSLSGEKTKVLIFSITHGNPTDEVLGKLEEHLQQGDIILDGGNEHYRTTERRQEALSQKGVAWIGMGVSGGYQSARRGPSLSPGGDRQAIYKILPLLEKFAAKAKSPEDTTEAPCTAYIGPRGSGHFVKMVHNGIENGMLSSLCEAWGIMKYCLGMTNDEIGKVLGHWNEEGSSGRPFWYKSVLRYVRGKRPQKAMVRERAEGKTDMYWMMCWIKLYRTMMTAKAPGSGPS
jgi:6-phosphogluconate dehydrogenase